jgi:hypothetical protein
MDHVARMMKYDPAIARKISPEWTNALSDLDHIDVDVLGYATFSDIDAILTGQRGNELDRAFGAGNWRLLRKGKTFRDTLTGKPYGGFARDNCVIRLSNLRQDWPNLISKLRANVAMAPTEGRDYAAFDAQINDSIPRLEPYQSWFSRDISSRPGGNVQASLEVKLEDEL